MMKECKPVKRTMTIQSTIIECEDPARLFLVSRTWDEALPKLLVISIRPAYSDLVVCDTTTSLCIQQSFKLGYGQVSITNLYTAMNMSDSDFVNEGPLSSDKTNEEVILEAAKVADTIIVATGRKNNNAIDSRKSEVLELLRPYAEKLFELQDGAGNRGYHPLSPRVKWNWILIPYKFEAIDAAKSEKQAGPGGQLKAK